MKDKRKFYTQVVMKENKDIKLLQDWINDFCKDHEVFNVHTREGLKGKYLSQIGYRKYIDEKK